MDDLLIVRVSDRSKERFSRKRRKMDAPIGMNFGMIIGIGVGMVAASKVGANPAMSLGIGVAFGVIFGGLAGRFFKRVRRYERTVSNYSYEGMPFETEEEPEPSSKENPKEN
jgi:hypothetical protein